MPQAHERNLELDRERKHQAKLLEELLVVVNRENFLKVALARSEKLIAELESVCPHCAEVTPTPHVLVDDDEPYCDACWQKLIEETRSDYYQSG